MYRIASSIVTRATLVLLAAGLAACGTVPDTITQKPVQPVAVTASSAAAPVASNGGIFQSASYRPLFEDRRARMVGDTLTITITENTSAVKGAANSASKTGSVTMAAPSLFGTTAGLGATAGSASNKFEEKGAASSSNTFTGTITVTVIDVLQNGNLVVSGEKQVAFDKATEYVRFSGVVNPDRINANVVPSTQVADARVEYRTNSRIDRAEFMSQVARFFMSMLPI